MTRVSWVILGVLFSDAVAAALAAGDAPGTYVMDARFAQILAKAANDRTLYPARNSHGEVSFATGREKNLRAAEALAALSYPDIRKLQRIRIDYEIDRQHGTDKRVLNAWLLSDEADKLVLVGNFFEKVSFLRKWVDHPGYYRYVKHEPVDFLAEIREAVRHDQFDDWLYLQFGGRIPAGTVWDRCYSLAVFAYELGHEQEADDLIRFGMRKEGTFLSQVATTYAFQDLLDATQALYNNGHEQAIPHLEHLLEHFAFTKYGIQARDLLDGCRKVVKAKAGWSRDEPTKLDPAARARYWAERLPDVAGMQSSDPGGPSLYSWDEQIKLPTDELLAIGRAAIPVLTECLSDDRPTRSIYFKRSFYAERHVVRVGGAAIACIERITHVSFYVPRGTGTWLYTEPPQRREAVIQDVKTWWEKHKDASEAEWLRSRIGVGRVYERARMLNRLIELEGYEKAKPILQGWLESEDPHFRIIAATKMAANGDLSAVPRIEKELLEGRYEGGAAYPGPVDLMCWILRQDKANGVGTLKQYIIKHPSPIDLAAAFKALEEAETRAALQACVELLDVTTPISDGQGDDGRKARIADLAAEHVQKVTKVDFGFSRAAPRSERDKVIQAIRKWWAEKRKTQD